MALEMSEVIPFLSEFTTKSTVFEVTSATVDVVFSAALVVITADASPFVLPCVGLLRVQVQLGRYHPDVIRCTVTTGLSAVFPCVGLLRPQVHPEDLHPDGWIGCTVATDLSAVSLVLVSIAKLQALTAHIINKRREVVATTFIFIKYYNKYSERYDETF